MSFRFEKLIVWQEARKYASLIYKTTKSFPKSETYGLVDQLRRASVSVALNIAEGSDRKSDKEFIRYLRTAITSIEEVVTALYISLDLKYISQTKFDIAYDFSNRLVAQINALINSLKKR